MPSAEDVVPTTVVSVECEVGQGWALVGLSGDFPDNDLDPAVLGLSAGLAERLADLEDRYDRLVVAEANGEPVTPETRLAWEAVDRDKVALAYAVRREVGASIEVLVDRVPLDEIRRRPGG